MSDASGRDDTIRIAFPDGSTFAMSKRDCGILFDADGKPVDCEIALELTMFKAWRLRVADTAGSA